LKTIILFTRLYAQYRNRLAETIKSHISNLIDELDVHLARFDIDKRGHVIVSLEGQDAEFAINFLAKEYGTSISLNSIIEDTTIKGSLVDVGKVGYGLYVDVAVINNMTYVDALLPLYQLREQFKIKKSLRAIAKSLVLVDNLPIDVMITSVNQRESKIEATFAESTLNRFDQWLHDDHERLLVLGASSSMINTALEKTGHIDDIYEIQELGMFEFALRCKRSTRASGIIAAIGPKLRGVPMHLFIPKEIEANLNAKA
jgi:hypothetical protein